MVKGADDSQRLLFANGTDCNTWTELPLSMIESIEVRDIVPCRDHTHPVVKLQLKRARLSESRVFAALAEARASAGAYRQAPAKTQTPEFGPPTGARSIWPGSEPTKRGWAKPSVCANANGHT